MKMDNREREVETPHGQIQQVLVTLNSCEVAED